ncbi:LacI family DNA-binding transcriptional regulator [Aliiglaciecola sp. M165]|uniref:LacI family DNA-binding transcriptional regulator n=1 Tax=Aliiglaciecola sp. M165 TaxID=2593649 RepID=UPI001180AB34|nr:LacI family DNA-binding transcriptional regulator [Aliiglaciecola sp. M165]TRY29826.1 LacI family transcriptional regulator [Aliiglaciecola sp. M165]
MKATIKDVADLAGVSFKTVSRVINKEGTVKGQTLEKVEAAIAQLNYQPNHAARNLATTRSYAIGYIYDNPNAYYVIDMQNGILEACRRQGYELIIHPCQADKPNIVDEIKNMIERSQLAGLVISPPLSEMPSVLSALEEMKLNFVRIISGSDESGQTSPCVFIHDCEAAKAITEHMVTQGHQRIAFISGDEEHHSTAERYKGYIQALEEHDIDLVPDYVFKGHYTFESGIEGAKQLLALPQPPTAIFCCNDEIAAGALFAARLMGLDVPEQLAIAGFEDSPFSRQTWPKLTTAAQPTGEIAGKAASALINHIIASRSQKGNKFTIQHQHFVPKLVERESSKSK